MDFNDKIKYFIRVYMERKMIKKCYQCGIISQIGYTVVSNNCNHEFRLYTNIYDINNKYLIDADFSKWINNNKEYVESFLNDINILDNTLLRKNKSYI